MGLNIYTSYEITVKNDYCYINEEGDHTDETETFTKEMCGGKLVEFIVSLLNDSFFSSLDIHNNQIRASIFDPMNGTGQDILIVIKELHSKQ